VGFFEVAGGLAYYDLIKRHKFKRRYSLRKVCKCNNFRIKN